MIDLRHHGGQFGSGKFRTGQIITDDDITQTSAGGVLVKSGGVLSTGRAILTMDDNNLCAVHQSSLLNMIVVLDQDLQVLRSYGNVDGETSDIVSAKLHNNSLILVRLNGNISSINLIDGTLDWSARYGTARDVAFDYIGNMYVVQSVAVGADALFKYDPYRQLLWKKPVSANLRSVAVDGAGNVYCSARATGATNVTIASYESDGTLRWSKTESQLGMAVRAVVYNPVSDLIYLISETTVGWTYTTEGTSIRGFNGRYRDAFRNVHVDLSNGELIVGSDLATNAVARIAASSERKFSTAIPDGTLVGMCATPDFVFTMRDGETSNSITKYDRYTRYRLL